MEFFGVGGSRSARTLHYFALFFLWGLFFFGGGFGGANNVLGWPSYKIFSWTCCYAIHSSLALYLATRYQLLFLTCKTLLIFALLFLVFFGGGLGGLITFLAGRLTRYSLGLAATLSTLLLHCTLKIADIRKERWPSQNEPRCAINDPAMDVASNNFAVFSQRIDVTPCRSDEETSWLSITASSTGIPWAQPWCDNWNILYIIRTIEELFNPWYIQITLYGVSKMGLPIGASKKPCFT